MNLEFQKYIFYMLSRQLEDVNYVSLLSETKF